MRVHHERFRTPAVIVVMDPIARKSLQRACVHTTGATKVLARRVPGGGSTVQADGGRSIVFLAGVPSWTVGLWEAEAFVANLGPLLFRGRIAAELGQRIPR